MSNTPEFTIEQLDAARSAAWHQNGASILTLEAARDFVTTNGLMLFAPRSGQLPAPSPSFVEATMGAAASDPASDAIARARALVGRLVSEGSALALNLLGGVGDAPDFIISAQAFSFLYTLRGDKNWKQPPATTGATKSSPLGVRVYEVLTEKGALTAAELAAELGRELTESAVLRALVELWSNLRVLPLYGPSDGPALWELATRRFTKAIKSGVNAGQPTALSALVSLYLAQALLATEEEIEVFLSPLSARSRIRDVTHALTNSRQLEIVVLGGKSLLHIPGTLPEFPAVEVPAEEVVELAASAAPTLEGEGRIKRFTPAAERPSAGEFRGKPARTFKGGSERPAFRGGARPDAEGRPDAERRPFQRSEGAKPPFAKSSSSRPPFAKSSSSRPPFAKSSSSRPSSSKPSFTKPWEEQRKPRAPRVEGEGFARKRPAFPRAESARAESRPEGDQAFKRPYTPREAAGESRPAKPPFPRPRKFDNNAAETSAADKPYRKFDAPRRDSSAEGGRVDRPSGDRPYRKFDAPRRAPSASRGGDDRPARSFGSAGSARPSAPRDGRSFDSKRSFDGPARTDRPAPRTYARKSEGSFDRPSKPWQGAREDGAKPRAPRPGFSKPGFSKPGFSKPGFSKLGFSKPGFSKPAFSKPASSRPDYEGRPERKAGTDRPGGAGGRASFGAKRLFGDRAKSSGFGGDRSRAPKTSSFGGGDRPRSTSDRPRSTSESSRPARSSFGGDRPRKPSGEFAKRPAGGKVPSGSKPPRGVNPRTANRAPGKRKPSTEE